MADKTQAELQAEWIAANNVITIRKTLDSGTDEFRYRILLALLANELDKFKAEPFL